MAAPSPTSGSPGAGGKDRERDPLEREPTTHKRTKYQGSSPPALSSSMLLGPGGKPATRKGAELGVSLGDFDMLDTLGECPLPFVHSVVMRETKGLALQERERLEKSSSPG